MSNVLSNASVTIPHIFWLKTFTTRGKNVGNSQSVRRRVSYGTKTPPSRRQRGGDDFLYFVAAAKVSRLVKSRRHEKN